MPTIIDRLCQVIAERQARGQADSYVASLLAQAPDRPAQKVIEEAGELAIAAMRGNANAVVSEAADLVFHLLVLLAATGVPADLVWQELERREGRSGLREREARGGDRQ